VIFELVIVFVDPHAIEKLTFTLKQRIDSFHSNDCSRFQKSTIKISTINFGFTGYSLKVKFTF
jgi:hypothetical protein